MYFYFTKLFDPVTPISRLLKMCNSIQRKYRPHSAWAQNDLFGLQKKFPQRNLLLIIVINFGVAISTKICNAELTNFFPDNFFWQIIHLVSYDMLMS